MSCFSFFASFKLTWSHLSLSFRLLSSFGTSNRAEAKERKLRPAGKRLRGKGD